VIGCWARGDVEALEKPPTSSARQAVLAEVVDCQPVHDRAAVLALAEQLVLALKRADFGRVGLDIGRLEALEVQLGATTVIEGTGVRIEWCAAMAAFRTGDVMVASAKNTDGCG
jgi:hypothetical protein